MRVTASRRAWLQLTLLAAVPAAQAASAELSSAFVPETTIVVSSSSLAELVRRPALRPNGSTRFSPQAIHRACQRFSHLPATRLVFVPATGECTTLADYERKLITARLDFGLRDGSGAIRLDEALEASGVVTISPILQGAPVICGCPTGNTAPAVQLQSGSPQTVEAGAPIAQIMFTAGDAENDLLSGEFSFTVDGAPAEGLPFGLHHSCTFGPGTAHCPVTGAAPYLTGNYSIELTVSDGSLTDSAAASLEVVEGETVYDSGFE